MATVLQTDRAWPDYGIEQQIIEAAGHRFVTGPAVPAPVGQIESLVRSCNPQAILTCWAQVSATAVGLPDRLDIVQRVGVGLDNIAVEAATRRGAWVANIPDYCVTEVADHAVGMVIDWARGITAFDRAVKAGEWQPASARLRRLSELTIGIVGLGRTGIASARRLRAFGCTVLGASRRPVECDDVCQVDLDTLLTRSDAVLLHLPLTPESHHLINRKRLALMRPGALLVNVSRGALVDTVALLAALEAGQLGGAALDVVEGEPDPPRALVERADVIVTPHIAFSSDASITELRQRAAENVVAVLAGASPRFACNRPLTPASH